MYEYMKTNTKKYILITLFIIIICIFFRREIIINLMFMSYDLYALYGYYWKQIPQYCSPMKFGFTPVMPLDFYANFNKVIFERISTGDNSINKEQKYELKQQLLRYCELDTMAMVIIGYHWGIR